MPRKKTWTPKQRREMWEKSGGICWRCQLPIDYIKDGGWHVGHVDKPEALGGTKVAPEHISCNMQDAWKKVIPMIAKSDRIWMKQHGQKKPKKPMPGSRGSRWKKCVNGDVLDRITGERIKTGRSR